jgi:hypothetical protein
MDCMVDTGVLEGNAPCQSQSQTVPKEPSPNPLMGVKERTETGGKSDGVDQDERGEQGKGQREGRTALCVSVSDTGRGDVESRNCKRGERLLRCRNGGGWTVSMALLDMLVGHGLSVLRIALLCDLGKRGESQSETRR